MQLTLIKSTTRSVWIKVFSIIAGLFLTASLLLVMLPTMLVISSGGVGVFFSKPIYSLNSPDDKYSLSVSRRLNFPVFDLLSPPATILVELRKTDNLQLVDHVQFEIHEFPELKEPQLDWAPNHVKITKIETHEDMDFVLRLR